MKRKVYFKWYFAELIQETIIVTWNTRTELIWELAELDIPLNSITKIERVE